MALVAVNPRKSIDDNRYVLDIFDYEILFFQQAFASLVAQRRPSLAAIGHWVFCGSPRCAISCILDRGQLDPRPFKLAATSESRS
jgi:hypothetical protein